MFFEHTLIYRSKQIISMYQEWIDAGSNVLDIGCGNGVVTDELRKHFGCSITGTDILDYRVREIPFKLTENSDELPFKDKEFDVAIINDVLHHCMDPEQLLREAFRVSHNVLVFELEPTIVAKTADYLVNLFHNPDMIKAINMRQSGQWMEFFNKEEVEYEYKRVKKQYFIYPFNHYTFHIKLSKPAPQESPTADIESAQTDSYATT